MDSTGEGKGSGEGRAGAAEWGGWEEGRGTGVGRGRGGGGGVDGEWEGRRGGGVRGSSRVGMGERSLLVLLLASFFSSCAVAECTISMVWAWGEGEGGVVVESRAHTGGEANRIPSSSSVSAHHTAFK